MRVAWFSPLPPARAEAASLAVELLGHTTARAPAPHLIDLFTSDECWLPWARWTGTPTADLPYVRRRAPRPGAAQAAGTDRRGGAIKEVPGWFQEAALAASTWRGARTPAAPPGYTRLFRAWEFVFAEQEAPYDLKVYQLGNHAAHDFIWPYALRWPGLVMLQQADLHEARAARLLYLARPDDYRRELAFTHPDIAARLAEYVIARLPRSPAGLWPMLRPIAASARGLVAHSRRLADDLLDTSPSPPVRVLVPGVPGGPPPPAGGRPPGPPVIAAIGPRLTPRLPALVRAFAAVVRRHPDARLLLLDETGEALDPALQDVAPDVRTRIEPRGYVPDAALPTHLADADVAVAVRWPTWREVSTRWLRALAAGLPTLVTDEINLADVPLLDPIDGSLLHAGEDAAATLARRTGHAAVAVAIDVQREETTIREALLRLARDASLRTALGRNARRFFEAEHGDARLHAELMGMFDWGAGLPAPTLPPDFPPHLLADGTALARRVLAEHGVTTDLF